MGVGGRGKGLGRQSLTKKTDHRQHVHYTQEYSMYEYRYYMCIYSSSIYNRTEHQTRRAPRPEGLTGGFSISLVQTRISASFPVKDSCLGSSFPKPLAFCLSACLSHVGAALREGEDFGLGIVGREGVLAGLCV